MYIICLVPSNMMNQKQKNKTMFSKNLKSSTSYHEIKNISTYLTDSYVYFVYTYTSLRFYLCKAVLKLTITKMNKKKKQAHVLKLCISLCRVSEGK